MSSTAEPRQTWGSGTEHSHRATPTLSGRLLPAGTFAFLHGRLRAQGHGRSRVEVAIIRLDREITDTGFIVRDAAVALTQTSRSGGYAVRIPLSRTAGFLAYAIPVLRPCAGSDLAPGGCRSVTTAGVESDPVTIGIP